MIMITGIVNKIIASIGAYVLRGVIFILSVATTFIILLSHTIHNVWGLHDDQ